MLEICWKVNISLIKTIFSQDVFLGDKTKGIAEWRNQEVLIGL